MNKAGEPDALDWGLYVPCFLLAFAGGIVFLLFLRSVARFFKNQRLVQGVLWCIIGVGASPLLFMVIYMLLWATKEAVRGDGSRLAILSGIVLYVIIGADLFWFLRSLGEVPDYGKATWARRHRFCRLRLSGNRNRSLRVQHGRSKRTVMATLDISSLADLLCQVGLMQGFGRLPSAAKNGNASPATRPRLFTYGTQGPSHALAEQKLLKGDTDGYFLGGYRCSTDRLRQLRPRLPRRRPRAPAPSSPSRCLRRKWSEDQQVDLFVREGKLGMTLEHPNIVEILAVNQDQVTQAVLHRHGVRRGRQPPRLLRIRKKLMVRARRCSSPRGRGRRAGLCLLAGMTHRDMKLDQRIAHLSHGGSAKLVDFGLAGSGEQPAPRRTDARSTAPSTTPAWRRPPAARGRRSAQRHLLPRLCLLRDADRPNIAALDDQGRSQAMLKSRFENIPPLASRTRYWHRRPSSHWWKP